MFITHRTSEKPLKNFWALKQMLPLQQLHLNSFQPPKPLFLLLRPPKGQARLVTKVWGWKWRRVRRLVRVELGQRIKAKAKKLKLCERLRAQRLTKARKLLLRKRSPSQSSLKLWPRRRRPPRARLLILLSPNQPAKQILPQPRLSLGFFSFLFFYFFICTLLLLWRFAMVYDVPFLLIMKRHYLLLYDK